MAKDKDKEQVTTTAPAPTPEQVAAEKAAAEAAAKEAAINAALEKAAKYDKLTNAAKRYGVKVKLTLRKAHAAGLDATEAEIDAELARMAKAGK